VTAVSLGGLVPVAISSRTIVVIIPACMVEYVIICWSTTTANAVVVSGANSARCSRMETDVYTRAKLLICYHLQLVLQRCVGNVRTRYELIVLFSKYTLTVPKRICRSSLRFYPYNQQDHRYQHSFHTCTMQCAVGFRL